MQKKTNFHLYYAAFFSIFYCEMLLNMDEKYIMNEKFKTNGNIIWMKSYTMHEKLKKLQLLYLLWATFAHFPQAT
jgi:hypothetical protein